MQQGAGQGQTLPLAAGQVAAAFGQLGVQAVLAAQEIRQVAPASARPTVRRRRRRVRPSAGCRPPYL